MTPQERHADAFAAAIARGAGPGRMPVHRWYMRHERPWEIGVPEPCDGLDLVRARDCTVAFYRFLYDTVGRDWLWGDMRRASDAAVAARLAAPGNAVHYLTVGGTPAGMVEVHAGDGETELAYVGLMPGRTGMGLGRWMLSQAIAVSLSEGRRPMTINTCSTDSAGGLALYTSLGFEVVDEVDFEEADPRAEGLIEGDAHPAMPRF